jgi:hypothetical protein
MEIGRATTDGSGRFRLDAPRTSSPRHDQFGAVALASGYGVGWVELDPDAGQPTVDITLRPEQVIQGRLFDVQGQPARDVKVSVSAIRRVLRRARNPAPEDFEGPAFWWAHPDDLPGWPRPVTTGSDGRFTVHGIGPGVRVSLSVHDPRFASQSIEAATDDASSTKPLTIALAPARTVTVRVTYADTGKPVPHAQVSISMLGRQQLGGGAGPIISETDAEGRFRANVGLADHGAVAAAPPSGQPYLAKLEYINWPKGVVQQSVDVALPRGVMIRGRVVEHGSEKPIAGAIVTASPHAMPNDPRPGRSRPVQSTADGSFELTVLPGPGYLVVRELSDDYVLQELGSNLFHEGQPGGRRYYAHAFIACDPKPGRASRDVRVVLRQGITVEGRVVGPDGQPVQDSWMFGRLHFGAEFSTFRWWHGDQHGTARGGRFELHGLEPDREIPVHFLDPHRKLGATARIAGKSAPGEPVTVRLAPCGTATARLVGPDGKPIGGFRHPRLISMVVTPGPVAGPRARQGRALLADEDILPIIDPINYEQSPVSDPQGRIVFPALIPGAAYRIADATRIREGVDPQVRKEFTVQPGETLDLGEVRIENPRQ